MGTIYKITNQLNQKSYIGKTESSIERRWKEHQYESSRHPNRALYKAINKYGLDNFKIETIEDNLFGEELTKKELYYISKFDTFSTGYNETVGGDGTSYRLVSEDEKEEVKNLYLSGIYATEISKIFNCSVETVSRCLYSQGVRVKKLQERMIEDSVWVKNKIQVVSNSEIIFEGSGSQVIDFIIKNNFTKTTRVRSIQRCILRVLDGTRKSYLKLTFKVSDVSN